MDYKNVFKNRTIPLTSLLSISQQIKIDYHINILEYFNIYRTHDLPNNIKYDETCCHHLSYDIKSTIPKLVQCKNMRYCKSSTRNQKNCMFCMKHMGNDSKHMPKLDTKNKDVLKKCQEYTESNMFCGKKKDGFILHDEIELTNDSSYIRQDTEDEQDVKISSNFRCFKIKDSLYTNKTIDNVVIDERKNTVGKMVLVNQNTFEVFEISKGSKQFIGKLDFDENNDEYCLISKVTNVKCINTNEQDENVKNKLFAEFFV